ncbi:MAG TPA: methyltransferase [Pseudolabrys sp.]|nr:methyltransferase [Pseudolabrys sp.]
MTDSLLVDGLLPRHRPRKFTNKVIVRILHFFGYHFLLKRGGTRLARVAGFELTIRPTVYDPRYYRAPEFFAQFIDGLDLAGRAVADVGTGSGLQALAAARAGAASVVAIDINPNAAAAAVANARANGFAHRISAVVSNLMSAIARETRFDVILSNPPFCDGPAWDTADRAWNAGEKYKDIAPLFEQARERLAPGGVMYLILSSHSDLELVGSIVRRAGFSAGIASQRRVLLETMIIYELRPATAAA